MASTDSFALQHASLSHGRIGWREAGSGPALVLLHGIGAQASSWRALAHGLADTCRVIAWDAPGYGSSSPLPMAQPRAADYAGALSELLDRLGLEPHCLVGHSMGALIAGSWAASAGTALTSLVLASPARGFGSAPEAMREARWRERVDALARLGPAGLAAERAPQLCAPGTATEILALVRAELAALQPHGYAQAAWMLSHDDLLAALPGVRASVHVLCGELDSVTPPASCEAIARAANVACHRLPGVGHMAPMEDPVRFNAALRAILSEAAAG